MFSKMKRFLCIGLTLMILLSGCAGGGNNQKKAAKGGYRETEIKMPVGYQQISNPMFLKDGRIIMVGIRMIQQTANGAVPAATKDEILMAAAKTEAATEEVTKEETTKEDASTDKTATEDTATDKATDKATEDTAKVDAAAKDAAVSVDAKPVDANPQVEYTPPEQKYDILTWQDLTKEPTIDTLKLPVNTYFDSQNALITDVDGNPVLRANNYDQEKGVQKFFIYWLPEIKGAGKDSTPVPPTKEQTLDLGESYPMSIVALPGGMFAAASWDSIKIYGSDGKKVKDLSVSNSVQMFRSGNKLAVIDREKSEVVFYDIDTLKESSRMKIGRSVINNMNSAIGLDNGTVYFNGQNGIYKADLTVSASPAPNTTAKAEAEIVLDYLDCSLADPNLYSNGFTVNTDKQIIIVANSNMMNVRAASGTVVSGEGENSGPQMKIFLYNWDPELDLSNKTVLTVSSLFTDQILRVAAFQFQKKHPEVKIKITQYYDKMEDQMKWSDFIRTVNTDILSGKIADIMFLDNLPLDSYTRRGILTDLNPLVKELGGDQNLNMGIVNGMKNKNGKLYALPLTFTTYALIGHKNVIDQVTDLKSLLTLKLAPDQKALSPMQKQQLFQQLLMANLPAFTDKQSGNYRFDTPEFVAFLELVMRIYKEAQTPPPELPENPTDEDYRKMDSGNFYQNVQKDRYTGKIAMNMTTLGNLDSLSYEFTYSGGKDAAWTFVPMVKDMGGQIFMPQTTLGISAKGKNQKLAIEFVKTIFSGELEGVDNYMWGFSVVKSQQEKTIKRLLEQYKQQAASGGKQQFNIDEKTVVDMTMLNEQQMRDIVTRLDKCTIPVQYDQTLYEFLDEEIKPYLYGRKTAKEAADSLQRRAAAYLAE